MQEPHGHHDLTWCMAETREREGRARAAPTHGPKARGNSMEPRARRWWSEKGPDLWMVEKREREGGAGSPCRRSSLSFNPLTIASRVVADWIALCSRLSSCTVRSGMLISWSLLNKASWRRSSAFSSSFSICSIPTRTRSETIRRNSKHGIQTQQTTERTLLLGEQQP
jgi:hypothetical protein